MGVLSRFADIMSANINALLDKCEDPAKMVDQTLRNLRSDLAQVKTETAAVMADEKNAKRKIDECEASIQKFANAARNAVAAGNDDDARELLNKKQQTMTQLEDLKKTWEVAKSNADKMQQMHDKLVRDIDDLEARKDSIKAKIQIAKAQQKVNSSTSGTVRSESSISAFERMEAKANKMLDQAQAEAELNTNSKSAENLVDKYSGNTAAVEDELAALKAELNK